MNKSHQWVAQSNGWPENLLKEKQLLLNFNRYLYSIYFLLFCLNSFYCSTRTASFQAPYYPDYRRPDSLPAGRFLTERLPGFSGKKLCLVTNQASLGGLLLVKTGNETLLHSVMRQNDVFLYKVFTPEHGLTGQEEAHGNSTRADFYVKTIYLASIEKMQVMFTGCQVMVFDLPDAGVRPFTYRTILTRSMQAMNRLSNGNAIYLVLDVPNPASYLGTAGPVATRFSYLGEEEIPFYPGYTFAEIAALYHNEKNLDVKLEVVKLNQYHPHQHFMAAGFPYQQPSPNLPTFRATQCYWASVFLEGTYLDIGRNSNDPFCLIGHSQFDHSKPLIAADDSYSWQRYSYKPWGGPFKGMLLRAYRLRIDKPEKYEPLKVAYHVYQHLKKQYPYIRLYRSSKDSYWLDKLVGTPSMRDAISNDMSYAEYKKMLEGPLTRFKERVEPFKLY